MFRIWINFYIRALAPARECIYIHTLCLLREFALMFWLSGERIGSRVVHYFRFKTWSCVFEKKKKKKKIHFQRKENTDALDAAKR